MSRPTVYLAGPITGLKYDEVVDWRVHVSETLGRQGIDCYSPMRAKDYLKDVDQFSPLGEPNYKLSTAEAITMRDHWDCRTRDLIFVNMLGAERVSIGTVMEVAWAQAYRKPIVLVMEDEGNPHEHGMFNEATRAFRFPTVIEAMMATRAILLP